MKLGSFIRCHLNMPLLVLGTGPSAWEFCRNDEIRYRLMCLIKNVQMPVIGINRAFDVCSDIPLTYQISTDRIWLCLLHARRENGDILRNYNYLKDYYVRWCRHHKINDWTFEDWIAAYHKRVGIHPEVMRYFKLCSPHAPFVRFTWRDNSATCPYFSIKYNRLVGERIVHGGCTNDALIISGNSAQTAIHLGAVMGADPIYLLGVDLTPPDPNLRPWERGAVYSHGPNDSINRGFQLLARALNNHVRIINLNPANNCRYFINMANTDQVLRMLDEEIRRWKRV